MGAQRAKRDETTGPAVQVVMSGLYADPEPDDRVADRPPAKARGRVTPPEHRQGNADLADCLAGDPEALCRALAAAVWRLKPAALRRVARLVIQETTPTGD